MSYKIDQFYQDENYGVMKFVGYSPLGNLIFDRYEKSFIVEGPGSGWMPMGQRVNLEPGFQQMRHNAGRTREIPPPQ